MDLKTLTEINAPSGHEQAIRRFLLDELKKLVPYAEDATFRSRFTAIKKENKIALAQYIKETKGIDINPDSIFDIQVKRLHEYKRQLMKCLHIIMFIRGSKKIRNVLRHRSHLFLQQRRHLGIRKQKRS